MTNDIYQSPLSGRYAGTEMLRLFSQRTRHILWRRLWVELARAQSGLGLPVTPEQVAALESQVENIDYDVVAAKEKEIRHDVMAHIYAFGLTAPAAAGIIHLGATSCYVTDNSDLILYRDGLRIIRRGLQRVIRNLKAFAAQTKSLPTLGYTHFQPAQLVTVGKRACLWLQDFVSDLEELDFVIERVAFLGCRGTTGTEASFMELFSGDGAKIDEMNRRIAAAFKFHKIFPVCGQTYPRKLDSAILNVLSAIAQSSYKFANDMRLLQHQQQLEEPSESAQVGSSAMAYKRNPMRCERICSLARYVMCDAQNAHQTAALQWLERTLDDSANRRISMPEGFLAVDGILRLVINVSAAIRVNAKVIRRDVDQYLPFIATENLLMESVKKGGSRQDSHEIIRRHSLEVAARMNEGEPCDLLERLAEDPAFNLTAGEIRAAIRPEEFIGRSAEQTDRFLAQIPDYLDESDAEPLEV